MTVNLTSLRERILLQKEHLTAVDQHIADYIFDLTDNISTLSLESLAQTLNVSKASITRFAKKLGYSGFIAMKHDLDYTLNQNYLLANDTYKDTKNYYGLVIKDYMELLSAFIIGCDFEQIINIVNQIHTANRILILGLGNSGNIAHDFSSKLSYLGIKATSAIAEDSIKIMAKHSDEHDFMICFSRSGTSACIASALRYAKENNTASVLITTSMDKSVQQQATFSIVLPGKELFITDKVLSNQIPQLFIAEVLYSEIIKLAPDYYEQKLKATNAAL